MNIYNHSRPKIKSCRIYFQRTPVVHLSNNYLTEKERGQLSFGLHSSFADKNRDIKKNLATNLEVVAEKVTDSLDKEVREDF